MNAGARTGSSAFLILQIEMPNPFRAPVCGCRHRIDGNLGKVLNPLTMRIHYSLYGRPYHDNGQWRYGSVLARLVIDAPSPASLSAQKLTDKTVG